MSTGLLAAHSIPASACLQALREQAVDHYVIVPDWVQLSLHDRVQAGVPGLRMINACNENQACTTAAGLVLGGRRPLVVMQNQGLYNCVNTLRAVCLDARIPLVLMVGQFGREYANFGRSPTESRRVMVRLMEPLLGTMGIPFHRLESAADLPLIGRAYRQARQHGTAVVLLVGAPMAWS